MLDIIKSMILGVIEGITEWLPISSTGHLILAEQFVKLSFDKAFNDMFDVVIQLGAILAVVILYWKKLWPFCRDKNTHYLKPKSVNIWLKVLVGLLPLILLVIIPKVLFDFDIDDWMDEKLHNWVVVSATLIIYGVMFIIVEALNKNRIPKAGSIKELSYKNAFLIGVFQLLSVVPGTSRSGSTILGGIILGAARPVATEYSFFMSVPVMFGASALKLFKYIKHIAEATNMGFADCAMQFIVLATGMVVAFLVSVIAIKFLISYIKKNDFKAFGYYRIVLGIIVILYFTLIAK